MYRHKIQGQQSTSEIIIGESIDNLPKYLGNKQAIIITDSNVHGLYKHRLAPYKAIVIGSGEEIKTYATVKKIINALIRINADRSTFLVGVGGGIVCDITGFVASIYMRGLQFGFVATTLLAQVDASVGGKNGVNFQGFKNLIGNFNLPDFVICDLELLKSLPPKEVSIGMAEIVKHTLIADPKMFAFIEKHHNEMLALKTDIVEKVIINSVQIKSDIVARDEKEAGERKLLNLGHTFGHAIEREYNLTHGEAVSIGINLSALLSIQWGYLKKTEYKKIINLLGNLNLPTTVSYDWQKIFTALKMDKKRELTDVHFVFLKKIGKASVEKIRLSELEIITGLV